MELYGIKLHILCSFTGGFILHRNDFWPNLIKIVVCLLLYGYFYLLISLETTYTIRFLVASIGAVFILIIELIVTWFNILLDESVAVDEPEDIEDIPSIPPGISGPLWEARSVFFNERIPTDERAYQLVRRGFDVDEVFRLYELIQQGVVTPETKSHAPIRRVKTNMIVLCGQIINIHFDRDSLSRAFTRPANNWHLLSCVIITFLLALFVPETQHLNPSGWHWYIALICCTAIFSLLLPPTSDPYSTNLTDPYLSYTRASICVGMTGIICGINICRKYLPVSTYIEQLSITITWEPILNIIEIFAVNLFRFYPILIFIGVFGHPLTTIHYLVETLNKYLFGLNGSTGLKKASLSFFWSLLIVFGTSLIFLLGINYITIAISIFVITFFIQFSISDNFRVFMRNHLFKSIIVSFISGCTSFLVLITDEKILTILLYLFFGAHFLIDIIIPYLSTHQRYLIFYGRILKYNFLTKYPHFITNFVTAPAFISFSLINDKNLYPLLGAILILQALRVAQTLPHIFSFSLYLTIILFQHDYDIPPTALVFLLSLLISRKLIKVFRFIRLWYKWRLLPYSLFKNDIIDNKKYILSIILCYFICNIVQPFSALSFLSFLWSFFTGSPMLILSGYQMLFTFCPPKPNLFYDHLASEEEQQNDNDNGNNNKTLNQSTLEHPLEAPIYLSLSEKLQMNLGKMIKDGELGLVTDDSFFLMISGEFAAILHIISIEANKISFQLRGLEYIEQTLCHDNEISTLQKIILEYQNFGNIHLALTSNFSMYELRIYNKPIEMVGISTFGFQDTVLPPLGRSALSWELKSLVYSVLKIISENPNIINSEEEENDNYLQNIIPKFSQTHLKFIKCIAENFGLEFCPKLLQRMWIVIHFIHTVIVNRTGNFIPEKCFELFEGKIEINMNGIIEENIICPCFRFSIASLLMISVGLEPTSNDNEELFNFFNEIYDKYIALPLRSEELESVLKEGKKSVITMVYDQDIVSVVRLSNSITEWSFFQMESECIRGFWANEIRSLLFFANSSRERNSIQFNVQSLRNLTNQSCNLPVGYPAYVTPIMESYSEKS